jgi:predicted  nucleic acid-binding Zn-ribbon protein
MLPPTKRNLSAIRAKREELREELRQLDKDFEQIERRLEAELKEAGS